MTKGETLRDAVKRLKKRIKITFNKSTYNEALESIKESNFNLKNIRRHAEELNSQDLSIDNSIYSTKLLPLELGVLRRARLAANAFYRAMDTSWTCEEKKHQRHLVRLFMNTNAKEDIRMNFLLLGDPRSNSNRPTPTASTESEALDYGYPDVFSLEVRSSILDYSECSTAWSESRATKRRRVKWANYDGNQEAGSSVIKPRPTPSLEVDVRNCIINPQAIPSLIPSRKLGCKAIADSFQTEACLGHLDIQIHKNPYRHSFYRWPGQLCSQDSVLTNTLSIPKSLTELFNHPIHEHYDIRDQLELAKTMVSVVLKFHSTPWLDHWWTLKDICFLNTNNEMTDVLNTLHLGAVFGHSQLDPLRGSPKDQHLRPGIKNADLYNLGVALIQIDRWKDLDSNATADIDKLATWSRFGPKYRDIVQRCLHCNFGVDYDLTKPKLQTAVLHKVMGELDSMLVVLTIDDNEDEEN